MEIPEHGYLKAENSGEGFQSIGWRFSPEKTFDKPKLDAFLRSTKAERIKAVFITEDGIFAYNISSDAAHSQALDECIESRIEIIANHTQDDWHEQLLSCMTA